MAKQGNKLAEVYHFDLYGDREDKYDYLNGYSIDAIPWGKLNPHEPNFFLTVKNFADSDTYEQGFKVDKLFLQNASGIKTQRDDASIKFTQKECDEIKQDFLNLANKDLAQKYGFKDVRDWTIDFSINDLKNNSIIANQILYRPFDFRAMNYTGKTKGVMGYPRYDVMKHLLKMNIAILTCRQQSTYDFQHIFISKYIVDMCSVSIQTKETGYVFPLYLYPETSSQQTINLANERTPNLNLEIVKKIEESLGDVLYNPEAEARLGNYLEGYPQEFGPLDLLDYIYAVLHSPTYRVKYKEFLKIDFPRIPYPKDPWNFWRLVSRGRELRKFHLLESPKINEFITTFPNSGSNVMEKASFENGKVWINSVQYFDKVPQIAWNFYIGGYQPAQKWLKDRKGRALTYEDIQHYQKIIVALKETDRIMKEIDLIEIE